MQELRDKQFETDVTRRLRFETAVSPHRQQYVKEQLLLRAAEQALLPPLEETDARTGLRSYAYTLGQQTLRILNVLLVDASMYERARRLPRHYQSYNAHGRHAYTIIRMSA